MREKQRPPLLHGPKEAHLAKFHKMMMQNLRDFCIQHSNGFTKANGGTGPMSLQSSFEIHGQVYQLRMQIKNFLRSLHLPGHKVFERDINGSTASSSSTQNVAFVSENTSSTNEDETREIKSNRRRECMEFGKQDGRECTERGFLSFGDNCRDGVDWKIFRRCKICFDGCNCSDSDSEGSYNYESDSDNEYVSVQTKGLDTPSFANKQVKIPRVNYKELGHGFTERACFVCGSFSHLIRDCDYHLTSTALKVNTVKPIVNDIRLANVFHKTHSPSSRPLKRTTVLRKQFSNQKVYTIKVKEVSTVGEKWVTADNPHRSLKNKGIIDSGCSRHMTGNKAYLADFQDFNGGPVAFGGSKGYIIGKGKIKTSAFQSLFCVINV
ncbi:hypothetical protein Tco_0961820 [Tanacetum coccineum]